MSNLNCPIPNPNGISGANPTQPDVPNTPTNQQRKTSRLLNNWNNLNDTPFSPEQLAEVVREVAYRRELAEAVSINPYTARQRLNVVTRQLEMMFGNQDLTSVNRFLTEARRAGENTFTALPLAAENLAVTAGRLDYARRLDGVFKEFQQALGSRFSTREKREIWVRFVEESTTARFRGTESYGRHAQQLLINEYNRFTDDMIQKGISQQQFTVLQRIAEQTTQMNDELLIVLRSLGLDLNSTEGVGFVHRSMTPDFQRQMRERRVNELLEHLNIDDNGRIVQSNTRRSRTMNDFTVEDEMMLAQHLGYTEGLTSHPIGTWRNMIERAEEGVTTAQRNLEEFRQSVVGEVDQLRKSYRQLRDTLDANLIDFQRRLNLEMADKRTATIRRFREGNDRIQSELNQMNRRTAEVHDRAREAYRNFQDRIDAEFQPRMVEIESTYNSTIETARANRDHAVRRSQDRLQRAVDRWNDRVVAADRKAREYRQGLAEGRRGYNPSMAQQLDEKLSAVKRTAQEELDEARRAAEVARVDADAAVEAAQRKASETYQSQMERLNKQMERSLDTGRRDIDARFQEQLDAHARREQSLVEELTQQGTERDAALGALDLEYTTRMQEGRDQIASRINQQRHDIRARSNRLVERQAKMEKALQQATDRLDALQTQFLSEVDEPIRKVYALMDDERRLLRELIDMPLEELNTLVDEGILGRVPMPSARMYEVLVKRYELPYRELGDMLVLDPIAAHRAYERNLQRSLGNTNMARSMVQAATEEGWGISRQVFLADKARYPGWVNAEEFLRNQRFDPDALGIQGLRDLYLPPEVAHHFAALVEVSTRPAHLNWFAQTWQTIATTTKRSSLATTAFVFRNMVGSWIQAFSAGANMFNFPSAVKSYTDFLIRGADSLDNVHRVYGGGQYTLRDVVLGARSRGRLVSKNMMGEGLDFMMSDSIRNRVWWMMHNATTGHPVRAVGDALKAIDIGVTRTLSAALMPTIWMEDVMQLTTLLSVLRDGRANQIGSMLSFGKPRHFTNLDEAIRYMDKYFIQYDNISRFDQFMGHNIAPFYTYVTRNIPMQLRNAAQNPGRFAAWMRLYGLMNRDALRAGEDLPESGIADWTADGMRIFMPSPDGDPNTWYTLNTEYTDQIAEAWSLFAYRFADPTSRRRVERNLPSAGVEPGWLNYAINSTHGHIRSFLALATRRDPFTRRDLNDEASFLGYEVPEVAGVPPGVVRYVLENNVPFVRQLNRSNPFGVFGVSEIRDANGEVIREARRSMFGNATRTDRDWQITGDDSEAGNLIRWARALGQSLQEHDIAQNVQQANQFYRSAASEFKAEATRRERQYGRESDEQKREQLLNEYILFMSLYYQTLEAEEDTALWLRDRGVITRRERAEEIELDVGSGMDIPPGEFGGQAIDEALRRSNP
jgi:hypothetical protein